MNLEIIFKIASAVILPQWLLMVFLPRRNPTIFLIKYQPIPIALGFLYLYMLAIGEPVDGGGFGTLQEVMLLFTEPTAVMAGWIHYLAFDLLAGSYILLDAAKRDIPHIAIVPSLVLCLFIGPAGLVLYFISALTFHFINRNKRMRKV
jgi:hypothetical protein